MPKLHHLALTTANLPKAANLYDAVFGLLGYERGHSAETLHTWVGPSPELLLYVVEGKDVAPHIHGRPGLQHVAMEVESRTVVMAVHEAAVRSGWVVVHEPKEYDYSDRYFAVFIEDLDGNRWEFSHIPTPTS